MAVHPLSSVRGDANWLAELFGRSELFVDRKGFKAWLAEANLKAAGLSSHEAIQGAIAAYAGRQVAPTMVGDVAIIDVCGPVTYKSTWYSMYFGGASIQDLQQQLRMALADTAVKTIVFKVDSPGGVIDMVPEFADEIFAARGQKPILAVADTMVCSAAYWLVAQADTIYASTTSQLGSIGVYCEHDDYSGMLEKLGVKITLVHHGDHKVDGNPYEPLSDAAREELQASVDEIGDWFETSVARARGVKKSVVLETFGQGKVFYGKQAMTLGLADKAGTFGQVIARLTKGRSSSASSARADTVPAMLPTGEVILNPKQVAAAVAAAMVGKKAKATCETCGKSSCPCTEPECPSDCPTCDPDCPCVKPAEDSESAKKSRDLAAISRVRGMEG